MARWGAQQRAQAALMGIVVSLSLSAQSQPAPRDRSRPQTTELEVRVADAETARPIGGAAVHVEWREDGQTVERDGTTNKLGIANFRTPRVKLMIEVSADDWETKAQPCEAVAERQTVSIALTRGVP